VTEEQLVELAERAFPLRSPAGAELEQAELSGSDRRYLERRALTWLVVEGRVAEAVPRVVALLRQDPGDRVLHDLLAQLENEMGRCPPRRRAACAPPSPAIARRCPATAG
jgi:hypothetical protein